MGGERLFLKLAQQNLVTGVAGKIAIAVAEIAANRCDYRNMESIEVVML